MHLTFLKFDSAFALYSEKSRNSYPSVFNSEAKMIFYTRSRNSISKEGILAPSEKALISYSLNALLAFNDVEVVEIFLTEFLKPFFLKKTERIGVLLKEKQCGESFLMKILDYVLEYAVRHKDRFAAIIRCTYSQCSACSVLHAYCVYLSVAKMSPELTVVLKLWRLIYTEDETTEVQSQFVSDLVFDYDSKNQSFVKAVLDLHFAQSSVKYLGILARGIRVLYGEIAPKDIEIEPELSIQFLTLSTSQTLLNCLFDVMRHSIKNNFERTHLEIGRALYELSHCCLVGSKGKKLLETVLHYLIATRESPEGRDFFNHHWKGPLEAFMAYFNSFENVAVSSIKKTKKKSKQCTDDAAAVKTSSLFPRLIKEIDQIVSHE